MLSLGIRYLNGWVMAAADGARKEKAEWPPHPDRIYMALAAAYFETDGDESERRALEWLETLPPPELSASEASERRIVTSYVPVNDVQVGKKTPPAAEASLSKYKKAGLSVIAEFRNRQPRNFPVAIPRDPVVHLLWPNAATGPHETALVSLCRKVTHIGHSASFAQMWVERQPPTANLLPVEGIAKKRLRVFSKGRLMDLEQRFNRDACLSYAELSEKIRTATGKAKKALKTQLAEQFPQGQPVVRRPEPGLWQGYDAPQLASEPVTRGSVFDPRMIVLNLSGRRPGLRATQRLVTALRGALLASCPSPIPEWVSGHAPDGLASRLPHLAILPLPFTGATHADGRIMGLGVVLPKNAPSQEVNHIVNKWFFDRKGFPESIRLFDGNWLECDAIFDERELPPVALRPETWTGPATSWATVTPVALDRHHKGKGRWRKAAETVKDACERICLPRPANVALHSVSPIRGVPRSNEFAPLIRKQGGRLQHYHAVLVFERPVIGPVLIGAGRFRGYGLCRPNEYQKEHAGV